MATPQRTNEQEPERKGADDVGPDVHGIGGRHGPAGPELDLVIPAFNEELSASGRP